MAQKRNPQEFWGLVALLIVILIPIGFGIYAYWNSLNPSQSQLPATTPATTTASAQPTATISLNNAASLPATTSAAELVPFSFTIKNTGEVGGDIPYKVYVQWSTGEEDVIDENVVTLAAGASAVIQESLKFEIANETAEVYLELTQTGQSVRFALPKA